MPANAPSNFVPLLPRTPAVASRDGTNASASDRAPTPAFAPMRVHGSGSCGPLSDATAREPVVTLQKEGDRVTGIRIECSCGQVIELACTY